MCMCMYVFVHNYVCMHSIVHAGPEAAVLDWYGPEADPLRILARGWGGGRGGGGGGGAGLQAACRAGLGKNEISDLVLRPLQYYIFSTSIIIGSRCWGVVTSYPGPFHPISLSSHA